jgi:hypothetical protein
VDGKKGWTLNGLFSNVVAVVFRNIVAVVFRPGGAN